MTRPLRIHPLRVPLPNEFAPSLRVCFSTSFLLPYESASLRVRPPLPPPPRAPPLPYEFSLYELALTTSGPSLRVHLFTHSPLTISPPRVLPLQARPCELAPLRVGLDEFTPYEFPISDDRLRITTHSFQDCSDVENGSSTCIPGFFGGATAEKPFQFSCQASWPDSTDWQPFLCVTINNNPLIGYFYNLTSPPLAQDSSGFNTLSAKRKREAFTFSESEERQTSISSGFYTAGTTIKTATNTEDKNYARATLGVLSLPQSVFNGLCVQNAAVRFLKDVSSGCVFESEESLCNSQSPWSALNYLMPNKLSQPACPLPPAVLAEGSLGDTVGEIPVIASTEVQYFCISDAIDSVSKTAQKLGEARCNFDDGDSLPPAPFFNKTTRTCSNVVTKVEYEFTWYGRRIDAVQAQITLGSVAIPFVRDMVQLVTSDTFINTVGQNFSVRFLHALRNSSNFSSVRQTPVQRSGNPGYVLGRPVLGRLLLNSTGQVCCQMPLSCHFDRAYKKQRLSGL